MSLTARPFTPPDAWGLCFFPRRKQPAPRPSPRSRKRPWERPCNGRCREDARRKTARRKTARRKIQDREGLCRGPSELAHATVRRSLHLVSCVFKSCVSRQGRGGLSAEHGTQAQKMPVCFLCPVAAGRVWSRHHQSGAGREKSMKCIDSSIGLRAGTCQSDHPNRPVDSIRTFQVPSVREEAEPSPAEIRALFQSPPAAFGPVPFCWWTTQPLDRACLAWRLDQPRAKASARRSVRSQPRRITSARFPKACCPDQPSSSNAKKAESPRNHIVTFRTLRRPLPRT